MSENSTGEYYSPDERKHSYDKMEHGKAKIAALRSAIEAADAHEDTPFRIFFRLEMCEESCFYGDSMEMMVFFPEALAIADRYPDTPSTCFDRGYTNEMDHILWVYKWILGVCKEFYQIPMTDCLKFFEDFKQRSQAYGYNLRPYYYFLYDFYERIDPAKAEEAFHAFERLPRDGNCDCKACERNTVVDFWLKRGQLERAGELAKDIEGFTLRCGHAWKAAWLRLKTNYMQHYLSKREFEKAAEYCRILEGQTLQDTEFQCWDSILYCYSHLDMGKALRIYKTHWKDWLENRNPSEIFDTSINIACFFRKLGEEKKNNSTIKLSLDAVFPLYQESGQYRIDDLYQYYYDRAAEAAEKFDRRNGSDYYHNKLRNRSEITL